MKAKTYALDDLIVVVMRGSGFTSLEQAIMNSGQPDRAVDMRHDFQHMMTQQFTSTIKELAGRDVVAFLQEPMSTPTSRWRSSSSTARFKGSAPMKSSSPNSHLRASEQTVSNVQGSDGERRARERRQPRS